ncbi:NAD-dependent epimerase/dehydratase family protein [Acidisoma cladoniae]|uniref:NAD-dependent epimerase/dehydratase family protein n=1 Tax=Acidisoma cladoniae TaxID=3040935 RepID=UPI00254E306A|nr:NAD-dependent epimerase/dehydratase family protein [Acidisoma sp. PAMC 29798]
MSEHHLILGGGGFIGKHVALLLAQAGHQVTLAGRRPLVHAMPAALADRVTFRRLELGSADWDALVAKADVVHHYAWGSLPASANANPGGDLRTNVGLTIDMLDALHRRGAGRVVFSSSGGTVYGKLHAVPVSEDHPMAPITAYGAGKATAEVYLGLYRAMHGLDCRIARIANPYGAGQDLSRGLGAVTTFLHHALNGLPITIWGTGDVVRDYIHIADAAQALVALAAAPRHETFIFNVGSGVGISLNEIVAELETRLGRTLDVTRTATRAFDVPISLLSVARAKSVLGWAPALSFTDGMARTLDDLRRNLPFSTLN